jgi:hypothetical protein
MESNMKKIVLATMPLMTIAGCFHPAIADETLKLKIVTRVSDPHAFQIGDPDGHRLGLNKWTGSAMFPDGRKASVDMVAVIDFIGGSGDVPAAYWTINAQDGSVLWFKINGVSQAEGPKGVVTGTVIVLGGKGKYEGAHDNGTIRADRDNAVTPTELDSAHRSPRYGCRLSIR